MGTDTPDRGPSDRPRLIFDYFTQLFAQVTNPPLDAIREELVTSLARAIGPEQNLLEPGPASCRQIVLPYPVISDNDLAKIIHINDDGDLPGFAAHVVDGALPVAAAAPRCAQRLAAICAEVSAAIDAGARIIVLSDRGSRPARTGLGPQPGPDPVAAAHRRRPPPPDPGARRGPGWASWWSAGDAREAHHVALLIGYGAAAVNPYLALESVAGHWCGAACWRACPRTRPPPT